jgi:Leucine rich repeat
MDQKTSIDSTGVSISANRENSVRGLFFDKNKKIFYLPENVHIKFPNILGISAEHCFIYNISKENFEGLKKLRFLNLVHNEIETIANDTFTDAVDLEKILLSKKFKFNFR